MAAVIAGLHAGIGGRAGLAEATGRQLRILVEAGRAGGRAGVSHQCVFVSGRAVDAAVIGQYESALVEGHDLGVCGTGKAAENKGKEERGKAHCGSPWVWARRSRPPRQARPFRVKDDAVTGVGDATRPWPVLPGISTAEGR
ncbi:hypothetical protein D3C73_975530 [compost metagenome]